MIAEGPVSPGRHDWNPTDERPETDLDGRRTGRRYISEPSENAGARSGRSDGELPKGIGVNTFKLVLAFCLCLVFAGPPVFAAEESELETLREQLEKMNRLVNVQKKALLNLEKRLRALEAGPAPESAAPREAPVQPGVPVPPKAKPPEPGVAAPKKEAF